MRAYALRLTGDRGRADDVVQETFLRAWGHLHRLDPDRSPLPWLIVVARNVAYGMGRRRSARVPETLVGEWESTEAATDPTAGGGRHALDAVLEDVVVGEALARISADHREALQCVFLQGLSVAEAAKRLGVPPGTVKSRTYYGLRALRLALEELGYHT